MDYYWYLNQSGTYTVDDTDDKKEYADTMVCNYMYIISVLYMYVHAHVLALGVLCCFALLFV